MLLDEDPAALIHNCTLNFNIAPDRSSLSRITSSLGTLSTARSHLLSQHRQTLKALSRQLSTLQSQHALTTQSYNAASHAQDILRLDADKFRIAKEASDLEIQTERLSSDVESARATLADLDAQGAEGGDGNRDGLDDEVLLKLKVYRMMGIEAEVDKETGLYNKAVVRSKTGGGEVRVVNVDTSGRLSRWFYANYFWGSV